MVDSTEKLSRTKNMPKVEKTQEEIFNTISKDEEESVALDDPFHDAEEVESDDELIAKTLDELEIDAEELGQREAEMYLESGTYRWYEDKCSVKENFYDDDKKDTDLMQKVFITTKNPQFDKGRVVYYVSGVVYNVKTLKRGRYTFPWSPDRRVRENDEDDNPTKNYPLITSYFFKKYERKPKTQKEIKNLITSCKYTMYITRGKNGGNYLNRFSDL